MSEGFKERVKVRFATCTPDLLESAIAKASAIRPELPLVVVSEPGERRGLKGARVEIAIVILQPRARKWRLRIGGLLVFPRCILAMNENLDYFDIHPHSAGAILQHIFPATGEWIEQSARAMRKWR